MLQTQVRTTSFNYSPTTGSNGEEDSDERRKEEQGSSGSTSETATCRKQQRDSNTSRKIYNEQQLLDIWNEKTENIYEDKTFLLTFVPEFKNLNHDQNYWAKMKMLGIMRKAKNTMFQPHNAENCTSNTSLP
jgi:hypothetical protein